MRFVISKFMSKNARKPMKLMMLAAEQRAKAIIPEYGVMRIIMPEHRAIFRAALDDSGHSIAALAEFLKRPSTLVAHAHH